MAERERVTVRERESTCMHMQETRDNIYPSREDLQCDPLPPTRSLLQGGLYLLQFPPSLTNAVKLWIYQINPPMRLKASWSNHFLYKGPTSKQSCIRESSLCKWAFGDSPDSNHAINKEADFYFLNIMNINIFLTITGETYLLENMSNNEGNSKFSQRIRISFLLLLLAVLNTESRALCMLSRYSTTELYPRPRIRILPKLRSISIGTYCAQY